VPLCEALSVLQKSLHYRGYSAEIAPTPNVKLWDSVTGGGGVSRVSGTARAHKLKADEDRAVSNYNSIPKECT
jgi:hypothetical protein